MNGWLNSKRYRFNDEFEANFERIRDEGMALWLAGKFIDHDQSIEAPTNSYKLAERWKIFSLMRLMVPLEQRHLAPFTWGLISRYAEIMTCRPGLVYFSMLTPRVSVKPHSSLLKPGERSRHQLCLTLPDTSDEVYIEVSGERRTWELGKVISFDDSYMHSVKNSSQHDRLVLIYDSNS